jgi:hypothetical protein
MQNNHAERNDGLHVSQTSDRHGADLQPLAEDFIP